MQGQEKGPPRLVLIAGGSGAIGGAVARRLARGGMDICITYCHDHDEAGGVVLEINNGGGRAEMAQLDLSQPTGHIEQVCERLFQQAGHLDVLVNCAAINVEAPALGMEDEAWGRVMQVNLSGAFRLARAAAKFMMLNRWGRIINVSSISASFGGRGQINYASAKAGVEAMTRVLALEVGRKGVLCNCVAPGVIETKMSARIRDEHGERLLEAISVNRFGKPEEVAEVIAFLAGERASYINGQCIHVDGGMGL